MTIFLKSGSLDLLEPITGLSRPVMGLLYHFFFTKRQICMVLVGWVCEIWTLSVRDTNNVLDFGRQILRKMFELIKSKEEWRIRDKGISEIYKRRRY